jgi:hypothetical protein
MRLKRDERRHRFEKSPKLVPVGSLDRVLLIGGKDLTMFQSIGLVFFGLWVAAGIGAPVLMVEFGSESGSGDHRGTLYLILVAGAMVIWGSVMLFNGLRGIVRNVRRRHNSK